MAFVGVTVKTVQHYHRLGLVRESKRAQLAVPTVVQTQRDAASRYELINHHREDQSPTLARLTTLVEAHLRATGVVVPHQ